MRALFALIARDLRLTLRHGADAAAVLVFFVIAVSLFPFGLGPDPATLSRVAAGIIWVTALLAALLALDKLFQPDYEDGTLEIVALAPPPLEAVVLAKALGHWLSTGVPLAAVSPAMALMLGLPAAGMPALAASLAIGTAALSTIGTVGAALVLGARRSGVLIALTVLPLTIPVLIFGVGAVEGALFATPVAPHLLMLAALFVASLPVAALAGAAAVREALR